MKPKRQKAHPDIAERFPYVNDPRWQEWINDGDSNSPIPEGLFDEDGNYLPPEGDEDANNANRNNVRGVRPRDRS